MGHEEVDNSVVFPRKFALKGVSGCLPIDLCHGSARGLGHTGVLVFLNASLGCAACSDYHSRSTSREWTSHFRRESLVCQSKASVVRSRLHVIVHRAPRLLNSRSLRCRGTRSRLTSAQWPLSQSCDRRVAVFREEVIDRLPQEILDRAVVFDTDLFELPGDDRVEMGRNGFLADAAWGARREARDGGAWCGARGRRPWSGCLGRDGAP